MGFVFLFLSIMLEIAGTTFLKLSNGFTVLIPSFLTIISYVLCFYIFSHALKTIEISVAYAIWSAFGIMVISLIGMVFFHESINTVKVLSILLIIIGTIGLKLSV